MVTSVSTGNNNSQQVQQTKLTERQQPDPAAANRKRDAEDAKRQAAAQTQNEPLKKAPPSVNTQGQVTGKIVNTTA